MAIAAVKLMTADDFLVWQQDKEARSELVDGIPIEMMMGASDAHDVIVTNVIALLKAQLRGTRRSAAKWQRTASGATTMTDRTTAATDRHFLYFADPMCSWCYGFAPVIERLAGHFEGRLPVRLVMGGLRAGNTEPMRDRDRDYIRNAWTRVGEASGQPFDFSFFERETFTYDTEPACRAVVTMRRLAPAKALHFKAEVSAAFYAHNRDTTDDEVLADVAAEAGMERAAFLAEMQSEDARNETFGDFLMAKQSGVEGFPLLAAGNQATGYALVAHGFRPFDGLPEAIEDWLEKGAPVSPPASA